MASSARPPGSEIFLRDARVEDAEAILEIYNREVRESLATMDLVPRTLGQQRAYLSERSGALAVLVAEDKSQPNSPVVGFASLSPFRDRPGYRTSVENSIYVRHDCHRMGIGKSLLEALIDQARSHGFHAIFARITGSRAPSMALHERQGFLLVGVEREVGRKFGQWLDVAVMQLILTEQLAQPKT